MLTWSIEKKILELKYSWKISRNSSDAKTNLFVTVSDGLNNGAGEVAPNARYNESPEQVQQQFDFFLQSKPKTITSIEGLNDCLKKLSLSHALRFGIESAFVHYLCHRKKIAAHDYFETNLVKSIPTSFSIPIMEIGRMKEFYDENNLKRFRFIKIKVNADEAFEAMKHLSTFCQQTVIVDANEAFHDVEHCIHTLEKIKGYKIEFIEQPMPASMIDESVYLKKYSPLPLFGDESITDEADFSLLKKMFNGVNIKLMKAGGYINGIRLLKEAKANRMKTMIGCMIETTLGISSAMNLASLADYIDLDSFLLIKNEPFDLIGEIEGELFYKNNS